MFEGLNHITLSGEEYPIKCDLLVLEQIQDKYGDLWEFERQILNWEYTGETDQEGEKKTRAKLPGMGAINFSLPLMINEGIDIENEISEEKRPFVSSKEIIRKIDMRPTQISAIIHDEFAKCFKTKNV